LDRTGIGTRNSELRTQNSESGTQGEPCLSGGVLLSLVRIIFGGGREFAVTGELKNGKNTSYKGVFWSVWLKTAVG
jgi:hypothetical protein